MCLKSFSNYFCSQWLNKHTSIYMFATQGEVIHFLVWWHHMNVSILLTWFHVLGIFFLFAFITQRKLQQRAEWKWGELKWTREDHGWTSTKDISLCCVLTTLDSWILFIFYCCCFLSSVTAFWNYDETLLLYTHQHIGLLLGSAYIPIKSNYWSSIFFMPTLGQL